MRSISAALFTLLIGLGACASGPQEAAPGDALVIRSVAIEGPGSVVTFEAVNESAGPIAITRAFGFEHLYFNLEIETDDGASVDVSKWELTKEPKLDCLKAKERMLFRIPIRSWNPVHGTDATCREEHCSSYPLKPGKYRVRAVYRPPQESDLRPRCPRVGTVVVSSWQQFVIEP